MKIGKIVKGPKKGCDTFKPWHSHEPVFGQYCTMFPSQDNAPFKLPYILAHTFDWGVFEYSIIARYKLCIVDDLPLRLLVFVGERCSQCLGALPLIGSLGPSCQWHHKFRMSLWGPLCANGVLGTPHGEVRDTLNGVGQQQRLIYISL